MSFLFITKTKLKSQTSKIKMIQEYSQGMECWSKNSLFLVEC
ncbi:hypothetical protein LEP1GSC193_0681 [Leptospira alstonii serovar Pingchang str. 80-412]|uniref:Uncharacterized protein n=1 Tax=Leptospira alstonii serovar Pingchang str. 80-412 TaxID=1218564 RepID=T0H9D5_9LEPT|nr:hypothetical protein LEP1GSC193_0681 [Leptospira alstonii serovar Pingchang str. 80-412]